MHAFAGFEVRPDVTITKLSHYEELNFEIFDRAAGRIRDRR
jgi:hypothetical protein